MTTSSPTGTQNIKLAFYKAQPGDFWGNAIAKFGQLFNHSAPPYCHVEIGLPMNAGFDWYSSASKNTNGTTGTRWIDEAVLFEHPERWDVYVVQPVRPTQDMIDTCNKEVGKAYDWMGIAGFIWPFGDLNAKGRWYCSEICHYVFFGKWMKRVSPIAFYEEIKGRIV